MHEPTPFGGAGPPSERRMPQTPGIDPGVLVRWAAAQRAAVGEPE